MIKARHKRLHLSFGQEAQLREYQTEAANCWNCIVTTARDHYHENGGKWIAKNVLQKLVKGRFKLHSQTIQALTDKFDGNRQTIADLRRKGHLKAKYPYRPKRFLTIPFKQMAIKDKGGVLHLSLSKGVSFNTGLRIPEDTTIKTAEIIWNGAGYTLSYTCEYPEKEHTDGTAAGVDIGEIHPVALCDANGSGIIVSGREIRSTKQLRNKSLAQFSRMISRCKKGSRRFKKLIRAKGRLKSKTNRQLRDMLHKATRTTINHCIRENIRELVIGDPEGVEKNTKKAKRLNRKSRQKVSQMEYGRIKHYLQYKAQEAGITSCLVNERNTSKECPRCGALNHVSGRTYKCGACGFTGHRDGKAGFLILRKKHKELLTPPQFSLLHQQATPKYRKRRPRERLDTPVCVDGPGVAPSSSVNPVGSLRTSFSCA